MFLDLPYAYHLCKTLGELFMGSVLEDDVLQLGVNAAEHHDGVAKYELHCIKGELHSIQEGFGGSVGRGDVGRGHNNLAKGRETKTGRKNRLTDGGLIPVKACTECHKTVFIRL